MERFTDFIEDKDTKVNAGVVYPHDVILNLRQGDKDAADKQWKNLPDLNTEGKNILVLSDVSGSMYSLADGSTTCMDISIGLGIYLAQKNTGLFQNKLISFTANPKLFDVSPKNSLDTNYRKVSKEVGYNTNLVKAYESILREATKNNCSQEDMPEIILMISDMQFDDCLNSNSEQVSKENRFNPTTYNIIKVKFDEAGYKLPHLVFWNVSTSYANTPVVYDDTGAYVAGFSAKKMEAICSSKDFTPIAIMEETLKPFLAMLGLFSIE